MVSKVSDRNKVGLIFIFLSLFYNQCFGHLSWFRKGLALLLFLVVSVKQEDEEKEAETHDDTCPPWEVFLE